MKKILFFAILACMFASCSSDGSREIQIDEVKFVPEHDNDKIEDYSKVSSILEIVPGKYEIAWKLVDDVPQLKNYDVSLKLKLRLKKHVDVKQEVFDKLTDNTNTGTVNLPHIPFDFELLDADGKRLRTGNGGLQTFSISMRPLQERRNDKTLGYDDKDKMMDFYRFLKSKPGTECEVEIFTLGMISSSVNCVEDCENARGVVCIVKQDDDFFAKYCGDIIE